MSFDNNTFIGTGHIPLVGRFEITGEARADRPGHRRAGAHCHCQRRDHSQQDHRGRDIQANGIWVNAYVKLNSVSPLVFGALLQHAGAGKGQARRPCRSRTFRRNHSSVNEVVFHFNQ
jgi:hypothetical protein